MPLNRDCLNRTYGPETFTVEAEQVEKYAVATLDPDAASGDGRRSVPPAFAFVPCWPVILEALADPDLGNLPNQIIHGEQRMYFERALRVGDVLSTVGTVTTIEPKGKNELYVLRLDSRDARTGDLVVRQENICVSLGSAAPEDAPTAPKPSRPAAKPDRPEPTRSRTVELPQEITQAYADASGDRSPVHLDTAAASALGFPGIIVHGMCLVAIVARGAVERSHGNGAAPPDVRQLLVRFAGPIQPGETLVASYWDGRSTCDFDAVTSDGRRVLTNGNVLLAE